MTPELVRRLVADQFPQWADLPVAPVPRQGHDNRMFRLGEALTVRLPSHDRYTAGITKEDDVLPLLADHLAVPLPAPVATGRPTEAFPRPWSVRRWIDGATPDTDPHLDRPRFAHDLGCFLRDLRAAPADGPAAGLHSFYRGCHPSVYGDQVQEALAELGDTVDADACRRIWQQSLVSAWPDPPVWFHGDVAAGNLLTSRGRLAAVIDFGTCGVGDPACDLVIAWTFLDGDRREVFRDAVGLDDQAWARARGWALWKALITLTNPDSEQFATQRRALDELMAEGH